MFLIILFLLQLFHQFVFNQAILSIGYVYIDQKSSQTIILAEPNTLDSLKQTNITICTTLTPIYSDIDFTWSIEPFNTNRFVLTEGFATIKKFTNSTQIKIATRNTNQPQLDNIVYTFRLDKLSINNYDQRFFLNLSAISVKIILLPSNYPFGYFEFSSSLSKYFKVSRYAANSGLTDSMRIDRKYGTKYRVLIELNIICNNNSSIQYIEYQSGEKFKLFDFSTIYTNDLNNNYPRNYILNLTTAVLLDEVSEIEMFQDLIKNSTLNILPMIGKFSTIYINVIDDITIIEFFNTNIYVTSTIESNITVSITRTHLQAEIVYVNFLTVPLYDLNYYPARAYLDYTPLNGQFEFKPNSLIANYTFKIYNNDISTNKKFRIDLLEILNCDNCHLGFKNKMNVFINLTHESFQNLLKWNKKTLVINDTIYFNPLFQLNKICLDLFQTNQSIQLEIHITSLLNTNDFDNQIIYFNSINTTKCFDFQLTSNEYCYSIDYSIQMKTSYFLNQNYTTPIVSVDSYKLNIFNQNCALTIQFDSTHIIINNNFIQINDLYEIDLSKYQFNNDFLVKLPLKIVLNQKVQNNTIINYRIDIDPRLNAYISNNLTSALYLNLTSSQNYLILNLKNINTFPFYLFDLNVTLLLNEVFHLYNLTYPSTLNIKFITKNLKNNNTLCGLISWDKTKSKFDFVNNERELLLAFKSDNHSTSCVINTLYSINIFNDTSLIGPINQYIDLNANNFYYQFNPSKYSEKQIHLKNNIYIDSNYEFLINLTSLISAQTNTNAYYRSIEDTSLILKPNNSLANGPAYLTTYIYYQLNKSNQSDINNYNLNIHINLNRETSFSKCKANLELLLLDSSSSLNQSDHRALNQGLTQFELILNDGEKSKSIDYNIDYLNNSYYYSNLILFGSLCFYTQDNLNVYCPDSYSQIPIQPNGLFSISNNSIIILDNVLNIMDTIEYEIERRYGSLNKVNNIYYSLTSANSFVDFFFEKNESDSIPFRMGQIKNSFYLKPISVLVNSKRDFYVYLTSNITSQISKYNNYAQISIVPFSDYINTIVFTRSNLILPFNIGSMNITINLIQIGILTNESIYCSIKSAGLNEFMPNYLYSNLNRNEILAYAGYDYEPIDSLIQINNSVTFKINSMNSSRFIFLYLNNPMNQARLIEPDSESSIAYSPFIKIGFQQINLDQPQIIIISFIETNLTTDIVNNFSIYLNLNQTNNSQLVDQQFELIWTAQLLNNSSLKINDLIKCGLIANQSSCSNIINCNSNSSQCEMVVNFKNDLKLYKNSLIQFKIKPFKSIYYNFDDYLTTQIDLNLDRLDLVLKSNSFYTDLVQFDRKSRFSINNKMDLFASLTIELTSSITNEKTIVYYQTKSLKNDSFLYHSADSEYDYEPVLAAKIEFEPKEKTKKIQINLRAIHLLDNRLTNTILYPRHFQVILLNCTPDCQIQNSISNVVIVVENINLWNIYGQVLNQDLNVNLTEIEKISQNNQLIKSDHLNLISEILENLIIINNSTLKREKILNILCNLMKQYNLYNYVNLLENIFFSYVNNFTEIDSNTTSFNLTQFSCTNSIFNYRIDRFNTLDNLNQISYLGQAVQINLTLQVSKFVVSLG